MGDELAVGDPDATEELSVTFRSMVEWEPGPGMAAAFEATWPEYRRWYLRDGEAPRPSYADCVTALRTHMPELEPVYERLVELAGGGDLEARFLSLWDPPPIFAACSLAVWTRPGEVPGLVRTYDYVPALCDTTLLASAWTRPRVLAMTDCIWGVLDGVNEHGLVAALAFGGRRVVGQGFAVTLILRYALEVCHDVAEALEVISRVPVNLAYNVALVDRSGASAIVRISPDRDPIVSHEPTCANRQGSTEWPEHTEMSGSVQREAVLVSLIADPLTTRTSLEAAFLAPPLYRPTAESPWGTVYTASYDTAAPGVRLLWADEEHAVSLAEPHDEEWVRTMRVSKPPRAPTASHAPGSAQMIFA